MQSRFKCGTLFVFHFFTKINSKFLSAACTMASYIPPRPVIPDNRGGLTKIFPPYIPLSCKVTGQWEQVYCTYIATRFSQSKMQQANGCSQLVVCIHTMDKLQTWFQYTGTGSIHALIDTWQSFNLHLPRARASYLAHTVYHASLGCHSEATCD